MKRNGGNPPRVKHGFVSIKQVRCPSCEDRGALRNDGRPRIIGGGQLKGATRYVGLTKASSGCEECKGKGWIEPTDRQARDPYDSPLKPTVALTRRPIKPFTSHK